MEPPRRPFHRCNFSTCILPWHRETITRHGARMECDQHEITRTTSRRCSRFQRFTSANAPMHLHNSSLYRPIYQRDLILSSLENSLLEKPFFIGIRGLTRCHWRQRRTGNLRVRHDPVISWRETERNRKGRHIDQVILVFMLSSYIDSDLLHNEGCDVGDNETMHSDAGSWQKSR